MSKSTVEAVRRDMFGGTLASQGRAFYVTLEFLAICKGVQRLHLAEGSAEGILSRPPGGPLRYLCSGHDIARRLAHAEMTGLDGHRPSAERLAELAPAEEGTGPDEEVIRWVGTLFSDLLVPRPNARVIPQWGGLHLYPYVGEMIHYDAVYRAKAASTDYASVERYLYRGGGALVYEIVRSDPDLMRKAEVGSKLEGLVADSASPLGRIAAAVGAHEPSGSENGWKLFSDDSIAFDPNRHQTDWAELLRAGLHQLLKAELPRPKTMELLMHWIPFGIAMHQLEIARLGAQHPGPDQVPVDLIGRTSPLRRLAQTSFEQRRRCISVSVARELESQGHSAREATSGGDESAQFYSSTLASIGHLNANTGLRHFVLRNSLLESIVFATVPAGDSLDFDEFCIEVLGDSLGLIVGERSPGAKDLLSQLDNGLLRGNQAALQGRLDELGLLENLSDATKRVEART